MFLKWNSISGCIFAPKSIPIFFFIIYIALLIVCVYNIVGLSLYGQPVSVNNSRKHKLATLTKCRLLMPGILIRFSCWHKKIITRGRLCRMEYKRWIFHHSLQGVKCVYALGDDEAWQRVSMKRISFLEVCLRVFTYISPLKLIPISQLVRPIIMVVDAKCVSSNSLSHFSTGNKLNLIIVC